MEVSWLAGQLEVNMVWRGCVVAYNDSRDSSEVGSEASKWFLWCKDERH